MFAGLSRSLEYGCIAPAAALKTTMPVSSAGPAVSTWRRRRHQGPAVFARLRQGIRRALPARIAYLGQARASEHHPDLPRRQIRTRDLLRDEVPARQAALLRARRPPLSARRGDPAGAG